MICAHTAQYISFFFTYEKKKIISQKHAVLQQDLNVKKMEGKRGGGTEIISVPPPYVFENYVFLKKFKFIQCQENV